MRQIDAPSAFMMSLVGLGFLYVGRLQFAVVAILAPLAFLALLGWTRWIFEPVGVYLFFGTFVLVVLLQYVYPALIAWREKTVPAKSYNRWYIYLAWVGGLVLWANLLAPNLGRLYGYQLFSSPADSMAPTLIRGDWIAADTRYYRQREPSVGELVVFVPSNGYIQVKRIAAGPGDELQIRSGVLYRNGLGVSEPYLHRQLYDRPFKRDVAATKLADDEYYVLGDFRDSSRDSRDYGAISKSQIIGRVETIIFSHVGGNISWDRFPKKLSDDT
jgi:signal peptidase I